MPIYRLPEQQWWGVFVPKTVTGQQPLVIAPFMSRAEAHAYLEAKYGEAAEAEGRTIIEVAYRFPPDDDPPTFDGELPAYAVEFGAAVSLGDGPLDMDSDAGVGYYETVEEAREKAESFENRRVQQEGHPVVPKAYIYLIGWDNKTQQTRFTRLYF